MADILTITDFLQQSDYQAGGWNTVMGVSTDAPGGAVVASQNMLIAEYNGKQIYREGSTIHGIWKSFAVDLSDAISETVFNGRCDRRIAFDSSGNCYTLAQVGSTSTPVHYLCHSSDYGQTWTKYALPGNRQYARIEFNDHPTRRPDYPPAVLLFTDSTASPASRLELVLPTISGGVVTVGSAYVVSSSESLLISQHSGGGNSVLTWGNRVLVAWPSNVDTGGGTNQYVTTFNRADGTLLETSYVGISDSDSPDDHDAPAITVDSNDIFHVILGAHHGDLLHVTSGSAGDYTTWNSPTTVDAAVSGAGHTYMALVCDSSDRLHVVTRDATEGGYEFRLNYFRRSAAGSWAKVHSLINPGRDGYVIYYHSLSILEDDALWVTGGIIFGDIWIGGTPSTEYQLYNIAFPDAPLADYKITVGTVTGTFSYGETITGGTSSATGVFRYKLGSTIFYSTASGTLQSGETLTGGTSGATVSTTGAPAVTHDGTYYRLQRHQLLYYPFALFSEDSDTWQASTLTFDSTGVLFGDVECAEFIEFEDVECSPILTFDLEVTPA